MRKTDVIPVLLAALVVFLPDVWKEDKNAKNEKSKPSNLMPSDFEREIIREKRIKEYNPTVLFEGFDDES